MLHSQQGHVSPEFRPVSVQVCGAGTVSLLQVES